ncbi:glycosyltransferase family 4 protein [bacterium]|nr:glycosyltransferase family 4 protein [bacterium]
MRLLVIPNDPLYRYAAKGVLKERYFNPCDMFDEVHVLSLAERDEAAEAAQVLAGRASVHLHAVGRPGLRSWPAVRRRALELARRIAPDLVRGYNPLLMGYLTVLCARAAGAVSVVSVHADYSLARNVRIFGPRFLFSPRGLYQCAQHVLGYSRTTLTGADHVICAYRFPTRWVGRWRSEGVSVIYNRVDLERFRPAENRPADSSLLRVLNVGRQLEGKDPEPILRAVAQDRRLELTLVGDGPRHAHLMALAAGLGASDRIVFRPSVMHSDLPEVYRSHDIFAMSITHPGVCIPVLEAAASGLPVVINRPLWEPEPEVVGALAEVVDNSAAGYAAAFSRLIDDSGYRRSRGAALRELSQSYSGAAMEQAECELYNRLLAERAARTA